MLKPPRPSSRTRSNRPTRAPGPSLRSQSTGGGRSGAAAISARSAETARDRGPREQGSSCPTQPPSADEALLARAAREPGLDALVALAQRDRRDGRALGGEDGRDLVPLELLVDAQDEERLVLLRHLGAEPAQAVAPTPRL